jgi:hypothetical protein
MARRAIAAIIACSTLTSITAAQVPDRARDQIRTRTGPPITQNADWSILSTGAWWIRVNASGTDAKEIRWEFGTSASELDVPSTVNRSLHWDDGRFLTRERDVPITDRRLYPGNMTLWIWEHLRPEPSIYIRSTTKPETASASFCVFYQQRGVALVQFTGRNERVVHVNTQASQCQPPPEAASQRESQ